MRYAATRGQHDETLEIVVLRRRLRRYERTTARHPRLTGWTGWRWRRPTPRTATWCALELVQTETALR
jgi:hypothetical protein